LAAIIWAGRIFFSEEAMTEKYVRENKIYNWDYPT